MAALTPSIGARLSSFAMVCVASLLAGCLVSFPDYAEGDLSSGGSSTGGGGGSAGKGGGGGSAGKGGASGGTGTGGGTGGSSATTGHGLIDDFEDGDRYIIERDGRAGAWYTANDDTGNQFPGAPFEPSRLTPARGDSHWAMHTYGGGFDDWGAAVRADFRPDSGPRTYDASAYTGIKFWARSGDDKRHDVLIAIPCDLTDSLCDDCSDHFGTNLSISGDWEQFELPFVEMEQGGWGDPVNALDPGRVTAFMAGFSRDDEFDLWVDDLEFY